MHAAHGAVLHALGRFGGAEKAYAAALEVEPDDAELYLGKGRAELAQDKNEAARQSLRQSTRIRPDHAEAQLLLGRACAALKMNDEALAALRRAPSSTRRAGPRTPRSARSRSAMGEADKAVRSYRKATELDPDDAETLQALADRLSELSRPDEAADAYAALPSSAPTIRPPR